MLIFSRIPLNVALFLIYLQTRQEKVTSNFIDTLKTIVGNKNVSTADAIREQHGHDESHHE